MRFKIVRVTVEHFEAESENRDDVLNSTWAKTVKDSVATHVIPIAGATQRVSEPWPSVLVPLKLLAKEGDRGAGDIIARTIGPIGGDAFKKWYKTLFGKSCGCGNRQDSLNARWPL